MTEPHDMTSPRHFEGMDTVTPVELSHLLDDDARALAAELAATIDGEVRFDVGSRAAYSTDASNYRQVPIGVVVPRTIDDVVTTVAACRRHGSPITSRGGGTSLAGQCTNVAVVMDFSKYLNRVCSIDPDAQIAVVEPGCNLDHLRRAAEEHGLTFGPDPATHDRNTLGGMIGNNSCGIHSVMAELYGPGPLTADQVVELDVLTYDGHRMTVGSTSEAELERIVSGTDRRAEIYRHLRKLRDEHEHAIRTGYPDIPRRVSGFNLDRLLRDRGFDVAKALVGTEGTCVVVLHATVRLIDAKPKRTLVALGYPDAYRAGDHVPLVREHRPVGLEGIDAKLIDFMRKKGLHPDDVDLLPEGRASCSSSSAPTPRPRAMRRPRRSSMRCRSARTRRPPSSSKTGGRSASSGRCASRVSARPPRCRACPRAIPAGRTRRSRRTGSATTSATSGTCCTSSSTKPRSTGTSARVASTAGSTSPSTRCTASPSGARSSTAPRTWSCPTAAPSPASTVTGRRAPRC